MSPSCRIFSARARDVDWVSRLAGALPEGPIRRIAIKPNWVCHESDPDFPIQALVTRTELIDAAIEACIHKYPFLESVLVGDVPIQGCDWSLVRKQAGLDRLIAKYENLTKPKVTIRDLRMQRVQVTDGCLSRPDSPEDFGDPAGYSDVVLDHQSFLDDICREETTFRVSDYSPQETRSGQRQGFHRYRVARSLLDCDLFINLAKMKTHQKAGLMGALKNLVGINGNNAYLVHFKAGKPQRGGDEFPPEAAWPVVLQARVHQWARGRSYLIFRTL